MWLSSAPRCASSRSRLRTESLHAPRRRVLNNSLTVLARLAKKLLAKREQFTYFRIAQFRTCLWPRVGWWASGQEAGQPPGEEPASLTMQPAAGGETGAPRAQRGTRLKATTERAFLATPARMPGLTEKACPSLPTVRNGFFPHPD